MSSNESAKDLKINTDKYENFFTEGLINYLLSTPVSNLPWLRNVKDVQSIATSFRELDAIDQRLYARLFARQFAWIRYKRISYFFVKDLPSSIQHLEDKGFVTTGKQILFYFFFALCKLFSFNHTILCCYCRFFKWTYTWYT